MNETRRILLVTYSHQYCPLCLNETTKKVERTRAARLNKAISRTRVNKDLFIKYSSILPLNKSINVNTDGNHW